MSDNYIYVNSNKIEDLGQNAYDPHTGAREGSMCLWLHLAKGLKILNIINRSAIELKSRFATGMYILPNTNADDYHCRIICDIYKVCCIMLPGIYQKGLNGKDEYRCDVGHINVYGRENMQKGTIVLINQHFGHYVLVPQIMLYMEKYFDEPDFQKELNRFTDPSTPTNNDGEYFSKICMTIINVVKNLDDELYKISQDQIATEMQIDPITQNEIINEKKIMDLIEFTGAVIKTPDRAIVPTDQMKRLIKNNKA